MGSLLMHFFFYVCWVPLSWDRIHIIQQKCCWPVTLCCIVDRTLVNVRDKIVTQNGVSSTVIVLSILTFPVFVVCQCSVIQMCMHGSKYKLLWSLFTLFVFSRLMFGQSALPAQQTHYEHQFTINLAVENKFPFTLESPKCLIFKIRNRKQNVMRAHTHTHTHTHTDIPFILITWSLRGHLEKWYWPWYLFNKKVLNILFMVPYVTLETEQPLLEEILYTIPN
jgi:hypothetical protein